MLLVMLLSRPLVAVVDALESDVVFYPIQLRGGDVLCVVIVVVVP